MVGCETTPTEPTEPIETEIPSVPNGLQALTAASDCEVPTLEGGWVCIWADEFEGDAVDETKWTFEEGGFGDGNQEVVKLTLWSMLVMMKIVITKPFILKSSIII